MGSFSPRKGKDPSSFFGRRNSRKRKVVKGVFFSSLKKTAESPASLADAFEERALGGGVKSLAFFRTFRAKACFLENPLYFLDSSDFPPLLFFLAEHPLAPSDLVFFWNFSFSPPWLDVSDCFPYPRAAFRPDGLPFPSGP